MTVRVYRSDDAGAPTLNGLAGSLITVLDACLVNGYGSKAGAGWSKPYSGTNLAAYRMGAGTQFYMRVADTANAINARFVGYETMSDVNTGTNAFPTNVQQSGGLYWTKSSTADSTARPWVIIASEKCLYMWVGRNITTIGTTTDYHPIAQFGDFYSYKSGDAYNCTILGATTDVQYNEFGRGVTNLNSGNTTGMYLARAYTQTGGSIQAGRISEGPRANGATTFGASTAIAYPDPITGGMLLAKVFVTEGSNVVRGHYYGLWNPLHSHPAANGDTFSGSGDLNGKTFIILRGSAGGGTASVAFETSNTW